MHRIWLLSLLVGGCGGCVAATQTAPPSSLVDREVVPPRPTDPAHPLDAVMWTMGYDLRAFDEVWAWLHETVPPGPERARAIGTACLLGVSELDRRDLAAEGLAALEEARVAFPEDDRLPMWHAFIRFSEARSDRDRAALQRALADLRTAGRHYAAFNLVGLTLSIGGYEDASPALIQEGVDAFEGVLDATDALQLERGSVSVERTRRLFDSPIAPYGIPALFAMMGDMSLRAGATADAQRHYYTALRINGAHRWPWRGEVERRLQNADAVAAGFAARPATEVAFGSHAVGALGVTSMHREPRFEGRVGNGSCTVCHTHLSNLEAGEALPEIGWIRGRFLPIEGVTTALPTVFALTSVEATEPPGGFAVGPSIPPDASRDFFKSDRFDGTFLIPVEPGRYFVALRATANGNTYQGYAARELLQPWFVDVSAGLVTDTSEFPIVLNPLP